MFRLPNPIARALGIARAPRTSMVVDLQSTAGLSLLKARLSELEPGEAFEGVKQCDGNNFPYLKGWVYRRRAQADQPGQHILVFFNGFIERAVVWLENGAQPLAVPPGAIPSAESEASENAIDLAGEQYFEHFFKDDEKIYICRHINPAW